MKSVAEKSSAGGQQRNNQRLARLACTRLPPPKPPRPMPPFAPLPAHQQQQNSRTLSKTCMALSASLCASFLHARPFSSPGKAHTPCAAQSSHFTCVRSDQAVNLPTLGSKPNSCNAAARNSHAAAFIVALLLLLLSLSLSLSLSAVSLPQRLVKLFCNHLSSTRCTPLTC